MTINVTALATSALGFTLALAWNDAISKTIRSFFPPQGERAAARATLVYAIVVTVLIVAVVAVVDRARRAAHQRAAGGAAFRAAPARGAGCADCAARCGLSRPIVRFWGPEDD